MSFDPLSVSRGITDLPAPTNSDDAATKDYVDSTVGGSAPIGTPELIYRYTVTGTDKASIDTGVDTPAAGSNDWTNGDLLEVWIVARTDDAGALPAVDVTLNNDTGSKYNAQVQYGNNTTNVATFTAATTKWALAVHGSGGSANYAAVLKLEIPGYAGTTFYKSAITRNGIDDGTAGNNLSAQGVNTFLDTAAVTRLKVAAQGTAKLKVGSQLLIYKRSAS